MPDRLAIENPVLIAPIEVGTGRLRIVGDGNERVKRLRVDVRKL
jgi:hypothetical protein